MQLQCRQYGAIAIISNGKRDVVIKRDLSKEFVEAHGFIASNEDWFFKIIPMLLIQQRHQEIQRRGA